MRNYLRILKGIYLDIRALKFILFGPREEKIGASNLNLRVREH
jgi:hypothetical protein